MDDLLFVIIAVAATVAFVLGILAGIWPTLLVGLVIGIGLLWLVRPLR